MRTWDGYGRAGRTVAVLDTRDRLMRSSVLAFYRETPEGASEPVEIGARRNSSEGSIGITEVAIHEVVLPNDLLEALANLFGSRDDTLVRRVKELEEDRAHLKDVISTLSNAVARS